MNSTFQLKHRDEKSFENMIQMHTVYKWFTLELKAQELGSLPAASPGTLTGSWWEVEQLSLHRW